MSGDKTKVTVEIHGLQYKLSGHASSGQMLRAAGIVDEQMKKIAKGFPRLDTPRLAVLAAVNIADDYIKLKEQLEQSRKLAAQDQTEELQELSKKLSDLEREHAERIADQQAAEQRAQDIAEQMAKLQEEYSKLQIEYNEWIQLVQSEPS